MAVYFIGPTITLLIAGITLAALWGRYGQRIADLEKANEKIATEMKDLQKALSRKLDKEALDDFHRTLDTAISNINTRFDDLRELILVSKRRVAE